MSVTIDGFAIDIAEAEQHSFENEITEHAVEKAANKADHVIAKPIVVTVDCVHSDSPFPTTAANRLADSAIASVLGGSTPSQDALAKLIAVHESRQPVVIETSLRVWRDMVCQSLSIPRDPTTGHALRFSATFKQIFVVTNEQTTIVVASVGAGKKRSLGHRSSFVTDALTLPQKLRDATEKDAAEKKLGYNRQLDMWAAAKPSASSTLNPTALSF